MAVTTKSLKELSYTILCSVGTRNLWTLWVALRTDKKEKQIFLIYKKILNGAVAKSCMRKGVLIYEEMRIYFPIYEEAVSQIWLCNCLSFLFYQCGFLLKKRQEQRISKDDRNISVFQFRPMSKIKSSLLFLVQRYCFHRSSNRQGCLVM
jgi:ribosomal protein S17